MANQDLIKKIAEKTGYSQRDVKEVIDAFSSVLTETLVSGEEVRLSGIGIFSKAEVPTRECNDPHNNSKVIVEAHGLPKFRASTVLKAAVR